MTSLSTSSNVVRLVKQGNGAVGGGAAVGGSVAAFVGAGASVGAKTGLVGGTTVDPGVGAIWVVRVVPASVGGSVLAAFVGRGGGVVGAATGGREVGATVSTGETVGSKVCASEGGGTASVGV